MIVLTGASGGIGSKLLPELLCKYPVVGLYNKNMPDFPNRRNSFECDITDLNSIKNFIDTYKLQTIENRLEKITIVHLAAIKRDELAAFCSADTFADVLDVNVMGNFLLTRELLKVMMAEKWGRIIHVISSGLGDVGTLSYSTSKYALVGMSAVLAREYTKYGITSNILQLGYFDTGMYQKLSEVKQEELLNQIPSKKLGSIENIVNAIDCIIRSDYINGATLTIDGGI
jgi:3-oxoacyl-[acyl-carrier protein] reductase